MDKFQVACYSRIRNIENRFERDHVEVLSGFRKLLNFMHKCKQA
jgi:hypothetical protein